MTPRVSNFMNPKLVYLREGDRVDVALRPILEFGITAVPVLDEDHRPVGVVSLRDFVSHRTGGTRASDTVVTIPVDAPLGSAGNELARSNVHHLVVVDQEGRAVGMLSALDVIRGLIGLEPKHPESIERFEGVRYKAD